MTAGSSRLAGRLAALSLLLGVIAAVAMLAVVPVVSHIRDQQHEITEQRQLLGRLDAFNATRQSAEAEASRSEAAIKSGVFLEGGTDALRTASLQALITEMAGKHGLRLSSSRTLAVEEENGLRFIGVQIELDADLARLQRLVLALEAQRPVLFIRTLQIAPSAVRRPGSDELRVRLGIAGAAGAVEAKL
jgi:hypothetical protein